MTAPAARSARAVTALIRRMHAPTPTLEYEHKQRLLAHARANGSVSSARAAELLGHNSASKALRLLGELVDEGLLERTGGVGGRVGRGRPVRGRWTPAGSP